MSDDIPFEIQLEIIKKVYDVKSLIRFRSVSKPWKSFIDSSEFINGYEPHHTQPHSCILRRSLGSVDRFICLVDDDNSESFKVQQQEHAPFIMSPFLKNYFPLVVGACHGLVCLYGLHQGYKKRMVVIWNPSIGKSFGIGTAPYDYMNLYKLVFGFGVCPVTRDPIVVKIICRIRKPWHVVFFTLSSHVWNEIPSGNLPRQSIKLDNSTQVVIDRFIYWGASDWYSIAKYIVSFDLITKEFKVVNLPDSLSNELYLSHVLPSKLGESLVVYGSIYVDGAKCCGVWVMEHDSSFRKLFSIGGFGAPVYCYYILGFRKSGEPIFQITGDEMFTTLDVYDPYSQQIKNLGNSKLGDSFFMGSKESLLLLDHSDLHIYCDDS